MRPATPLTPWLALPWLAFLAACSGSPLPATVDPETDATVEALSIVGSLPSGTLGSAYEARLEADGGTGEGRRWTLVDGSLPAGLDGASDGFGFRVAGAPIESGRFAVTVEVAEVPNLSDRRTLELIVTEPPPASVPSWRPTQTFAAPLARADHTAIWTSFEMIVWGGHTNGGPLGDGGAYEASADRWFPIATDDAPAPRTGHTAVWTGNEMLVFGGIGYAGLLSDGAAYDPRDDSWRALAAEGAPDPRYLHSAVWTGTEMIVWGGQGVKTSPANATDAVLLDGAAYDPSTDTWRPLALPEFAARGHSAVWTGAEMVVWGGRNAVGTAFFTIDGGASYNAASDSWSNVSTVNGPGSRGFHTAVWDAPFGVAGGCVVVWGGWRAAGSNVELLSTGSRYEPQADLWQATTMVGAPAARKDHTAVCTGRAMTVWGGVAESAQLWHPVGDGASYDPTLDRWTRLPTVGAPLPRSDHTAVWTGEEMILWGGVDAEATFLATGGVWTP